MRQKTACSGGEAYSGGKAVVAGGKGERLEGKGWRGKVQREEKKRSDFRRKEASDKDLNFRKFKNVVTEKSVTKSVSN